MNEKSAGLKFRLALEKCKPLQIVGTINAYCAMLAEDAGHEAIYPVSYTHLTLPTKA